MGKKQSKLITEPVAKLDRKIDGVRYEVIFETEPFASGACRLAFKGVYRGNGPLNGKPCVTKVFIEDAQRHYEHYQPDVKASQKANEYAAEFNAEYSNTKPLRFIVPEMAKVTQAPAGSDYAKPGDHILVEDFIEGNYDKYNSNSGWCSDEVAAIPAFSHYTYWKSDGALLVCDIQGVRTPTGYTLTDPAVLSRHSGQFGPTDMGPSGMSQFFKKHKCTSICKDFPEPKFDGDRKINRGREYRRASSYTFMLRPDEVRANKYYKNRSDLPAIMEEDEAY